MEIINFFLRSLPSVDGNKKKRKRSVSPEITEQKMSFENYEDSFIKTEKKDSMYEPLAKRFKFDKLDKPRSEWQRSIRVFKSDTRSMTGHLQNMLKTASPCVDFEYVCKENKLSVEVFGKELEKSTDQPKLVEKPTEDQS